MLRVRRATATQRAAAVAADREIFGCESLADDLVWVLLDGPTVVGYCALRVMGGRNTGAAFMSRAWVAPTHRGRGAHRLMVKARMRECERRGLVCVTYTARDNHRSANTLMHAGFRLYEPAEQWGIKGGLYMRWTPATVTR